MNDIISIFFFILLISFFVLGVIYTFNNNSKLKKLLASEKILYNMNGLEIIDTEALGAAHWFGNMIIYENYIRIEKTTIPNYFFHFIVSSKNPNSKKKPAGTINLTECSLQENNEIKLKGIKHRVLHNSSITIRIKNENKASLKKMNEIITTYFLN